MKKREIDVQTLIATAIAATYDTCMTGIDEKIQEAVNLGVTIGAATGAEIGAAAAIRAVERERKRLKKQRYDKRFQNTKLLLQNYRNLNKYYHNAVFDTETAYRVEEDFEVLMRRMDGGKFEDNLFVESIKRNHAVTHVIMTHVNKMLDIYRVMCNRSNRAEDKRHWNVLEMIYIDDNPMSADEIAQQESIDKRTVYKDIEVCVADMTTLLFGVGGIEKM